MASPPPRRLGWLVQYLVGSGGMHTATFLLLLLAVESRVRATPWLDESTPRDVKRLVGRTASLSCLVHGLGDETVLWYRHGDPRPLSAGRYTLSMDRRLSVRYHGRTGEWILLLRKVQPQDAGLYGCHVSRPPLLPPLMIGLHVYDPVTHIVGGPEQWLLPHTGLNLTCQVMRSPHPPAYIYWIHRNQVLSVVYKTWSSRLEVFPEYSGRYTCNSDISPTAHVDLHISTDVFAEPTNLMTSGTPAEILVSWGTLVAAAWCLFL